MGQEGAWTADVSFTDVRVDDGALIGGSENVGYRAAMTSLARGRVHIAALAVGAAQRALDESVAYAATATQGGALIGSFQLVQAMLADQQTGVMPAAPWSATPHGCGSAMRTAGSRRRPRSSSAPKCRQGSRSRGADSRRQWIHAWRSGRTYLPRRSAAATLRRHQRDSATHNRFEPSQGGAAMNGGGEGRLKGKSPSSPGRHVGKAVRMPSAWQRGRRHHRRRHRRQAPGRRSYPPATADDLAETVRLVEATTAGSWPSPSTPATMTHSAKPSTTGRSTGKARHHRGQRRYRDSTGLERHHAESFRDVMDINVTGTWNTVMAGANKIIEGAAAVRSS